MRLKLVPRLAIITAYCFFVPFVLTAQENFTGINDSVINLACGQTCTNNLLFRVPHLKTTEDYNVVSIPYTPYDYTTATGNELTDLYNDDAFSSVIPLPFRVCFYGSWYDNVVIGSNGLLTFDVTNGVAGCDNAYQIGPPLPSDGGGSQCALNEVYYPRASIMGMYSDLNPQAASSPADRKIEWRVEGIAPFRRFVASWYNVGVYGNNCGLSNPNTFQIVVNEGTGVIEVFIAQKICFPGSVQGGQDSPAILGIQNWDRNKYVSPPGKNAELWTSKSEGYRFIPTGAVSRHLRAELLNLDGSLRATITPAITSPEYLDLTLPNLCPAGGSEKFILRNVYSSCSDPAAEIIINDTFTVVASNLGATAVTTPSTCGVTGSGSITVSIPPANAGVEVTYSLDGGTTTQDGPVFNNLLAGNYTVTVSDASGTCTSTIPVTIASTGVLSATLTQTATSCPGAPNGAININANGVPPIQYSINNGNWVTGTTISGLVAGTYFVVVRDNTGCVSNNLNVTVSNGSSPVTGTATGTPTSCAGQNNGVVTITASGAGPFEYSLNGGANWQASNVFNGLAPGSYTATIRAGGICTSAGIPVTVTAGNGLVPILASTPTTCSGVNNGTITVTIPSGTTPPYTVVRDGTTTITNNSTIVFTGIGAGTHFINITDATGCSTATPFTILVEAGTGFTASFTASGTSCSGVNDGSLTITPQSPGTAPYTFALSPGGLSQTGNANTVFTGLAPATYSVLITDDNGCQYTLPGMTVTQGAGLTATATATPTACTGVNNGSIAVTSNGTAPFTFVLDGSVTQSNAPATTVFTNLAAGEHSITVTDANGCVTSNAVTATVTTGSGFTATQSVTAISCAGGSDGTITVTTGTGGTAPYSFVLNGTTTQSGAAGTTFTGLPAGTNTIVITDASGCTFTLTNINIQEPAVLTITMDVQPVLCNGQPNGSIKISANGGTAPYEYSLDGNNYQASNLFSAGVGTYTVYVRDAKGCTVEVNGINLTEPAVLGASIVSTSDASCAGGDDGTIVVTANGGTAPYEYSTDGTNFTSSATLPADPGTYTVFVRDASGCTVQVTGVTVGLTNDLTLTPMTDPAAVCEGSSVQLQPVTNATSFSWSPATGLSNAAIANPQAGPDTTTLYTLTAILGRCTTTGEVNVEILPAPVADAGPAGTICYGQDYQLQGSGGSSYTWSPSVNLSDASVANPQVIKPLTTTTYSLQVVDDNDCVSLEPATVVVTVTPPIKITVSPADTVVYAGAQFQLFASSDATSYTWSPGTTLNNPAVADPVVTAPMEGEELNYQVVGTTDAGCRGEAYVTIRVYKGPDIYMANAFTPNNDGKNDLFIPFPVGIKQLNYFRVYNRWGQLLFSTSTLNMGWNGRLTATDQPAGVYIWQVQGITENNKLITKQGTVTLIR